MDYIQRTRMYVFLLQFTTSLLSDVQESYFQSDSRYNGALPVAGILWNVTVDSHLTCVQQCSGQKECMSTFYGDGDCIGYNNRMHDELVTVAANGMLYYEPKGALGNVAEGKPAKQSTTFVLPSWGEFMASQAVDGRRYPVIFTPNESCACTQTMAADWWRVDLVDTYTVIAVAILPRVDAWGEQVANLSITVGETESGLYTECGSTDIYGWFGTFRSFTCPSPIYGRFVQLTQVVAGWLMCLCEIEVYVVL